MKAERMTLTEDEINARLEKYNNIFAIWTDRADFTTAPVPDTDRLLEVRAFSADGEFHAIRSVIGKNFSCREISGDNDSTDEYSIRRIDGVDGYDGSYDEVQYLDIDTTKSGEKEKRTIGGGKYTLPDGVDAKANRIRVRYYYKFDVEGIARKADWRLVGFAKEGE